MREQLLVRCRAERIEPPTAGRIDRIVRSALHQAEVTLSCRIAGRLSPAATVRLEDLVAVDVDVDEENAGADHAKGAADTAVEVSVLGLVKSVPGNVSLESMLTEIRKLRAVRAIGLPANLFADVTSKVLAGWRTRAAVESPSHLRPVTASLSSKPQPARRALPYVPVPLFLMGHYRTAGSIPAPGRSILPNRMTTESCVRRLSS